MVQLESVETYSWLVFYTSLSVVSIWVLFRYIPHLFRRSFYKKTAISSIPENLQPLDKESLKKSFKAYERKFGSLRYVPTAHLWKSLKKESPYTLALILPHLDVHQSASILGRLNDSLQQEVIQFMLAAPDVHKNIIEKIEDVLERQVLSWQEESSSYPVEIQSVAHILNHTPSSTEKKVLTTLSKHNPTWATHIQHIKQLLKEEPVL